MKGNRTNHVAISGDRVLGDRFRAYAKASGKSCPDMAREMHWNPIMFKTHVRSWVVLGHNPRGKNAEIITDYLRRMKAA